MLTLHTLTGKTVPSFLFYLQPEWLGQKQVPSCTQAQGTEMLPHVLGSYIKSVDKGNVFVFICYLQNTFRNPSL